MRPLEFRRPFSMTEKVPTLYGTWGVSEGGSLELILLHGFHQVTRPIDVEIVQNCDVISEQL